MRLLILAVAIIAVGVAPASATFDVNEPKAMTLWTDLDVKHQGFNERTANLSGYTVAAEITVYEDRSFTFTTMAPLAAALLKKAAGVESGSAQPNREKVGSVSQSQLRELAEMKMADLNANSPEQAMKIIAGTARSMGVDVER